MNFNHDEKSLKIWSPRVPFSLDPLDFDSLAHHICFRSVLSPLVSDYKLGQVKGIIAEKWMNEDNYKKWTFFIREDLYFSNGKKITPHDVAYSLNRAAIIMLKNNSSSGVFEFLKGSNESIKFNKLISGISIDKNSVVLEFTHSVPELINKIGFGLYSIVSSEDFDSNTGEWKAKNYAISSGPYVVKKWEATRIELQIRPEYPKYLLLRKPIKNAEIIFGKNPNGSEDIIIDFDDSLAIDKRYTFFGPIKSAIRYVECQGWDNKNSICYNIENRKILKKLFYSELDKIKFPVIKSFFPLAINNVKEFEINYWAGGKVNIDHKPKTIQINSISPGFKSEKNYDKISSQEAFFQVFNTIGLELNIGVINGDPRVASDFKFKMTAILVDSPFHDIQFMFNSKQGIQLPDMNGEIKSYISNESFDVQKVNELLWNQNIVWPMGHMSLGLWIKDSEINLENYNLVVPPLDLQWIGWN